MGLFDFFHREELLQLQKLVLFDSPDRLIMSRKELTALAKQVAQRDYEIMQDCSRILQQTKKPDVFFTRLDLFYEKSSKLTKLAPYIDYSGVSPYTVFEALKKDYQEIIHLFLVRYFADVYDHARDLKTDKAKLNRYQKFYDSLQPYYDRMDEGNKDFVETKYRVYTEKLIQTGGTK